MFLQRVSGYWTYILLVVMAIIILFPFVWLLSSSLKNEFQFFAIPIQWIPKPFMWSNYVQVFTQYDFGQYIFNSLWLAVYAMIVPTFVSAIVAYGFARFRFPGRTFFLILVLSTIMLPAQILTVSMYAYFRALGWVGTFLPIIVPQLFGNAFSIFLFRQFFMGLPREIDEAARIDGCGHFRILWNIVIPQSKPVLIVVAIFSFLGSWQDAWNPLIYLNNNGERTIPIGLLYFENPLNPVDTQLMAATVIALVVPVILYALGQRYIDTGVSIADVK
jgi:ABC-type glycerol-3-phosphate transport system permease component